MFKISKKFFYIILFGILWLITAFSSFFHAVEFFELSNVTWMGVILALAFEIGQASTLMSILTSKQNQKKYTPWILMCILTLVQIIGNVYSSYKYIMLNSPENLKYFKEPIFIWTQLPDDQATVIVTYVSAAILPIVALLMTSMITNYLSEQEELELGEEVGEIEDEEELEDNDLNVELEKKDEEIARIRQELEELKQSKENTDETEEDKETLRDDGSNDSLQQENENVEQSESTKSENDNEDSIEHIEESNGQESDTGESEPEVDDTISEGTGVEETSEEKLAEEPVEENVPKRESHFINL